ncbi:MAG: phosphatidylinositol-specific phospholipase C/glycerophosphodiester phosphodiesterase family protein [Deinococcus sp.]|nr:phosphatidylinositol-specific phospholipase C/glycerophosphodiester phosphodiesterase family protein [Deinococcus sp.]
MRKFAALFLLGLVLGACAPVQTAELAAPALTQQTVQIASALPRAHAHNDYEHERPLLDALAQGFTSVESDVFLRDGQLLVAHEASQLQPGRTLQSLYLEPLRQIAAQNGGRIYPAGQSLTLYVDVKDDGEATYQAVHRALAEYAPLLTRYENGHVIPGAVSVVISGNRVPATMQAQTLRYAGMDGRLSDLGSGAPPSLIPIISDNWTKVFGWTGEGEFPAAERQKLKDTVAQAHADGQRVRFWATPENPAVWQALIDAGVDQINTDDLSGLRTYLLEHDRR